MRAVSVGWTLASASLLVLVGVIVAQQLGTGEGTQASPDAEEAGGPAIDEDSGATMDLEHLTDQDLEFLQEVLAGTDPGPRRSAAKALVMSNDPRGVELLFKAAADGLDDSHGMCLGALEVVRLQRREEALEGLLSAAAMPLPVDCARELQGRLAQLSRGGLPASLLNSASDETRGWLARDAADDPSHEAGDLLLKLVNDSSKAVRRTAWLAWMGRDTLPWQDELIAASERESDPELAIMARRALED